MGFLMGGKNHTFGSGPGNSQVFFVVVVFKKKYKQTYLQSWYKTFISLTRTLGSLICKADPITKSTDQCWGNYMTKPLAGSKDISEWTSMLPLVLSVALGKSVLLFVQIQIMILNTVAEKCFNKNHLNCVYIIAVLQTLPSTKEVKSVTFAAFLLPAGKFSPSLSNFSLKQRPPFLDFAL